ncbi:MAG: DnaJ domain-containing protein [Planctomycetota bacterium]|nr:DnaJ domain-containing protein [Planctomycetota bacterium]
MLDWLKRRAAPANRSRSAERFRTVGLRCAIGEVVDLSALGVRVRFVQAPSVQPGDMFDMVIASESQRVRVPARVAWVRRSGMRGGELGAKFEQVRPGVAAALVQLARFGFITTDADACVLPPEDPARAEAPAEKPATPDGARPPMTASIEVEDLYSMLGVPRTATEDEIKKAYHARALELHPDRNSSDDAAARFADLAKAYKVLRASDLRARYDALLSSAQAA